MALRVPPSQIQSIKKLLDLTPTKIDEFLKALETAKPQYSTFVLADDASKRVDIPKPLVNEILRVLAGLYLTRDREGTPVDIFVDQQVFLALKASQVFADESAVAERWPKLRKFFIQALALHKTVGIASKAGHVHTRHERVFQKGQVLTDIRPIFHLDVDEEPDAAVIVHMLCITQRDSQHQFSDVYFAMDGNDLKKLKVVLERAMKKEDTLRKTMEKTNITCLYPEVAY